MIDRSKYLMEDEVKQLLRYAEGRASLDIQNKRCYYVRQYMLIHLLLETGVRGSEARLIKHSDIHLGKGSQIEVIGKGGKKRTSLALS